MASNALKGLGQGLFAAAGTLNQGMMADIQDRRQKEAEARRDASIEKRWQAESAARKAERAEDAKFRKDEKDADRAENAAWRDAQMSDRQADRKDQAAFRAEQLDLNKRKALSDDISKVDQQAMVGMSRINERYARAALKLQEQGLMGPALEKAIGQLEGQMKNEVAQFASQADVRRRQVAEIYGQEGLEYVKGMSYAADFGIGGDDVNVDKIVETAKTSAEPAVTDVPTVEAPGAPGRGFGAGFKAGIYDVEGNTDTGWKSTQGPAASIAYPIGASLGAIGSATGRGLYSVFGESEFDKAQKQTQQKPRQ